MADFPTLPWFERARERTNSDATYRKLGTADLRFGVRQGDALVEVQLDAFEIATVTPRAADEVRELEFCIEMDDGQWRDYLNGLRGIGARRSIQDIDLTTPGGVVKAAHARGRLGFPRYLLSIERFFENGARVE